MMAFSASKAWKIATLVLPFIAGYSEVGGSCIDNLDYIYSAEKAVVDDSVLRSYVLCPHTKYKVALNFDEDGIPIDGQYPIALARSNIHVRCGDDGRVENECELWRGMVHVAFTDEFSTGKPVENAILQGITFFRASSINVIAVISGDLTIRDCLFKKNWNVAPIFASPSDSRRRLSLHAFTVPATIESMLQRRGAGSRKLAVVDKPQSLYITISGCTFLENALGASPGAETTAMVLSLGATLDISDCHIVGTTVISNERGDLQTLVDVSGASVNMNNNCFIANDAEIAPVLVHDSTVDASMNFVQRSTDTLPSSGCEFISHTGLQDFPDLRGYMCHFSDSKVCEAGVRLMYDYGCVDSLDAIYHSEDRVIDDSVPRTYVLCPETEFHVANTFEDGEPVDGSYPIVVGKPNIRVLCGIYGMRSDDCTLSSGMFQLVVLDEFDYGQAIYNALIQGVTFAKASSMNVYASFEGEIVFQDCKFQDNANDSPIVIKRLERDQSNRKLQELVPSSAVGQGTGYDATGTSLVEFQVYLLDCLFQNNTIGTKPGISGLISNHDSSLTIVSTRFYDTKNEAAWNDTSYLIGNFGGTLQILGSCISDSWVNIAPVLNVNGRVESIDNAGDVTAFNVVTDQSSSLRTSASANLDTPTESGQIQQRCPFIASLTAPNINSSELVIALSSSTISLNCTDYNSRACLHADSPSSFPTQQPSMSVQPSATPTLMPTRVSSLPTNVPSTSLLPTNQPSFPPTATSSTSNVKKEVSFPDSSSPSSSPSFSNHFLSLEPDSSNACSISYVSAFLTTLILAITLR